MWAEVCDGFRVDDAVPDVWWAVLCVRESEHDGAQDE